MSLLLAQEDGGWLQLAPTAASRSAEQIDALFLGILLVTGAIFLLLVALLVLFGTRYRAGSGADRRGGIKNVSRLELLWITTTLLVFVGLFVASTRVLYDLYLPPAGAETIHVVGQQWMWKVHHANGQRELNELHVPTGRAIKLVLTSQDVIHSFFVPAFRLKHDALPGRYTSLWFQATRPGVYHLFCAEYCGTDHAAMRGRVVVMEPAAYEAWLEPGGTRPQQPETPGAPGAPLAARGREAFFAFGCNACHVPTAAIRAPRLDGLWQRPVRLRNGETVLADEQYVRESILEPNAKIVAGYADPSIMPTFRGLVTEDDLRDLVELIRSLEGGWPAQEAR